MTMTVEPRPMVYIEDSVVIRAGVAELAAFRRWAQSDDFPERGRIDFLHGTIEVDMSEEELQNHGLLKSTLHVFIFQSVAAANLGRVFVDRARLSSVEGDLSCEPDVVFISLEALRSGRTRYVPSAQRPKSFVEIEGAADLVVEVVSDSSTNKDKKRLPPLYARAGVRELWLADARKSPLEFRIFHLQGTAYQPADVDAEGFQASRVLGKRLRLRREPWELPGTWTYFVDEV